MKPLTILIILSDSSEFQYWPIACKTDKYSINLRSEKKERNRARF